LIFRKSAKFFGRKKEKELGSFSYLAALTTISGRIAWRVGNTISGPGSGNGG
jgi:hypothetical protein